MTRGPTKEERMAGKATLGDEVTLTLRLRRLGTTRRENRDGETVGVETVLVLAGAQVTEGDIAALNALQHERELRVRLCAIQRPLLTPELGLNGLPHGRRRKRTKADRQLDLGRP
jgi:hypothetical protein